jgi:hypothetical protein
MTNEAAIRTDDLGRVLEYLEGLELILERFGQDEVGREADDPLIGALQGIDHRTTDGWMPLRYQGGVGQGWGFVAQNVRDLRRRLLDAYSGAAR